MFVHDAIKKMVEMLGVIGGDPNVVLIFTECCHMSKVASFKYRKSMEKAPSMFTTLVMTLVFEQEGGDVVHHRNSRQALSTFALKKFSYIWLGMQMSITQCSQRPRGIVLCRCTISLAPPISLRQADRRRISTTIK